MICSDVEFIEQPTHCESVSALAQVRENSPVAIAADQLVVTPCDAFNACREKATDLIVLGLHGTGITTCATNQVAATIPNLDDGNQYMNHLLAWDIVKSPGLTLQNGKLPILKGPGLGFELDRDAISRASELHRKHREGNG